MFNFIRLISSIMISCKFRSSFLKGNWKPEWMVWPLIIDAVLSKPTLWYKGNLDHPLFLKMFSNICVRHQWYCFYLCFREQSTEEEQAKGFYVFLHFAWGRLWPRRYSGSSIDHRVGSSIPTSSRDKSKMMKPKLQPAPCVVAAIGVGVCK